MGRLLKVYLKNIFQQKTYYICMGISLAMAVILPFILGLFIKTTDTITFADRVVDCFKIDLIVIVFIASRHIGGRIVLASIRLNTGIADDFCGFGNARARAVGIRRVFEAL